MMATIAGKLLAAFALCSITNAAPAREQQVILGGNADLTRVHDELSKAQIIPTVVDDFQPILGLSAEWESSNVADLGNTLKPGDLQSAPSVSLVKGSAFPGIQITTTYVLTLTDPDAPSRDNPKWSEFCHWIATGVSPSSAGAKPAVEDVVEYKPPGPPVRTGKHRYVFLVWIPANGTTERLNLSKPEERKHWGGEEGRGVRNWAKENGLIPVAANFIYAQNEKQY
ncbi:phosphatidylethanolamine-binding protein [Colletotrichum truncatum]|uniref:Phosphatidylethanolamine-binding protein n=1 Tax=Colletotrichum truncatum TaxID=5467 RepID=A0ACC3YQD9_COLTU|nr:phosphatidylethanolamine-binding protein [Colletotrichum truncatum]KAF6796609.1 phosphatidylethanolamine-binding protein [Colletotrichum truncatum]